MKSISKFVMAAFAASALIPAAAMAQAMNPVPDTRATGNLEGFLVNNPSGVVMSATGDCWRHKDMDTPGVTGPCNQPAPVAVVPPAPRPVIAAAPPPPAVKRQVSRKISLSGDALFAFDKSVLKPEGKVMLDDLVRQLEGKSFDRIQVTGFTDRFGSNQYNQKLSERRAATVKDYLVAKNVQSSRIEAEGKGEMQPVTKAGDCPGVKATTKIKACLQPDRRVDVVMSGTEIVTSSN